MPDDPMATAPSTAFREVGIPGLKKTNGMIQEEFLRDLQGTKANQVFGEMSSNDATVGATLFVVEMIIRGASWEMRPFSDDEADVEVAEFVESCRNDMSHTWDEFLSECLSFLPYGWSYFEEVMKIRRGPTETNGMYRSKYRDGKIGWRKFALRGQETLSKWELDENGGIQGMWQSPSSYDYSAGRTEEIFIPIDKAVLFRTRKYKNNPQGKSLLRNAYRAWYLKKRIEEIEGIGIERDLAGLPKAFVPPEILDDAAGQKEQAQKAAFIQMITNLRRDEQEGILIPAMFDENGNRLYDIELMTTGGRRQFDTDKIISRWDHRIAMSILADFVLLGHQNVGSFALSKSKLHLFAVAIDSFLNIIADGFNRFAIPRLLRYNGMDAERAPELVHGTVEEPDIEVLGDYVRNLSNAGIKFGDMDTQNYLRSAANLPATVATIEDISNIETDDALDDSGAAATSQELDTGTEAQMRGGSELGTE